jgi:hypothetical protein
VWSKTDALISAAKKEKKATQLTKKPKPHKQKKGTAGTPAVDTRRKQQNVKKTVTVPISKKEVHTLREYSIASMNDIPYSAIVTVR